MWRPVGLGGTMFPVSRASRGWGCEAGARRALELARHLPPEPVGTHSRAHAASLIARMRGLRTRLRRPPICA